MPVVDVYSLDRKKVGTLELSDSPGSTPRIDCVKEAPYHCNCYCEASDLELFEIHKIGKSQKQPGHHEDHEPKSNPVSPVKIRSNKYE